MQFPYFCRLLVGQVNILGLAANLFYGTLVLRIYDFFPIQFTILNVQYTFGAILPVLC